MLGFLVPIVAFCVIAAAGLLSFVLCEYPLDGKRVR